MEPARALLADHARRGSLYALVGATAAGVTWVSFLLLHEGLGLEAHAASVLGAEMGILWAFLGHSTVTFRSLASRRAMGARFLHFHLVALLGVGANLLCFSILFDLLHVPGRWAQLLAIPFAAPFNYLGQRYWTWAK
ncbi:MAG TPA: GtrA family protein [Candidatus Thermoplasmatota archaeon]|nr:GtrA family protein [Candidatus Thermoplasmatota archaeon]